MTVMIVVIMAVMEIMVIMVSMVILVMTMMNMVGTMMMSMMMSLTSMSPLLKHMSPLLHTSLITFLSGGHWFILLAKKNWGHFPLKYVAHSTFMTFISW